MFLAVTTATRNFVIICLFLAEDSTLAGLVSLNCERKVPSPNFGPYVSFLTQRRRFLSRLHVIAATASRENSSWLIDLLMSRAKNYVSALDKRPAIHSPLCPPLCSSLSLSLSFFNYRPLVSIQFETIVTTFSRQFSIHRPSPEVLSARSFWLLRFFAYPDSRLFHLLYRWIESRFDYTYGYWKSLFFFLLKKFLSSFRAREKVDRFRLPSFWKIGGEGRRKNINCERYVCVRRMIERRDIYLFLSLSLILCFSKLDGEIIVETCHQSSSRISFVETWKHCFVLVRGHRTNRNDRRKWKVGRGGRGCKTD